MSVDLARQLPCWQGLVAWDEVGFVWVPSPPELLELPGGTSAMNRAQTDDSALPFVIPQPTPVILNSFKFQEH